MKERGHTPIMMDWGDGEPAHLDVFVCEEGWHNGPGCETCGASWCHHCLQPESIQPCTKPFIDGVAEPMPLLIERGEQ